MKHDSCATWERDSQAQGRKGKGLGSWEASTAHVVELLGIRAEDGWHPLTFLPSWKWMRWTRRKQMEYTHKGIANWRERYKQIKILLNFQKTAGGCNIIYTSEGSRVGFHTEAKWADKSKWSTSSHITVIFNTSNNRKILRLLQEKIHHYK